MNFLNLQYFLAVAEELSMTKAAERLYVSQQALSNHIAKLERELNTQLFYRTPKLSLTLSGRRLQKAALQIADIRRQLMQEVDDINNNCRGELRIGISYTRGQAILPQLLPIFRETHPMVEIKLVEGSSAELEEALTHGMIDLLFGLAPILMENIEITEISRERLFLVVPSNLMQELFGEKSPQMRAKFANGVDITHFASLPFILLDKKDRLRSLADKLFREAGISPNILLETKNIQTAFALSLQGMGLTVYPELLLKCDSILSGETQRARGKQADFFLLSDKGTTETLVIAHDKERYLSNAAKDFIRLSREVLSSGLEL